METKRVARRKHSAEFRAEVVLACRQPDASVAAIALRKGLNANVVYRWLREEGQNLRATTNLGALSTELGGEFLPVQLPQSGAHDAHVQRHTHGIAPRHIQRYAELAGALCWRLWNLPDGSRRSEAVDDLAQVQCPVKVPRLAAYIAIAKGQVISTAYCSFSEYVNPFPATVKPVTEAVSLPSKLDSLLPSLSHQI